MNEEYGNLKDEILILQSQRGQINSFEELVQRWQKRLWVRAFRITRDESASWDIVQDTWRKAVRYLSRLENPAAFPGWITRITSNLATDWIRKEIRHRNALESYACQDADTPSATRGSRQEIIRSAFARLRPLDCEILTLFYIDERSLQKIAGILGIPEGTAKSRLHYARTRLKKILEEQQ